MAPLAIVKGIYALYQKINMDHVWAKAGNYMEQNMGMICQLYGQVKPILRNFLMLPFLEMWA